MLWRLKIDEVGGGGKEGEGGYRRKTYRLRNSCKTRGGPFEKKGVCNKEIYGGQKGEKTLSKGKWEYEGINRSRKVKKEGHRRRRGGILVTMRRGDC